VKKFTKHDNKDINISMPHEKVRKDVASRKKRE